MLDWLTWPADLLLNAGAVVASWFISKDATNFILVQMMVATLVLAAIVAALVYWQSLVEFWQSRWRRRDLKRASYIFLASSPPCVAPRRV